MLIGRARGSGTTMFGAAARGHRSRAQTDERRELLDSVWRLEHPRVPDVLDALGSAHPDKVSAKAARKALAKHRSMLAERRGR